MPPDPPVIRGKMHASLPEPGVRADHPPPPSEAATHPEPLNDPMPAAPEGHDGWILS